MNNELGIREIRNIGDISAKSWKTLPMHIQEKLWTTFNWTFILNNWAL